jgi:hypothetical protein
VELTAWVRIESGVTTSGASGTLFTTFALHSLPASPAEIPERFSSSLLPPSFAAGRCAASLFQRPAGSSGGPLFHAL